MPDDLSVSPLFGLSQRLPPSNLQAEQALLGALLANNKAYDRVGDFLLPDHFADPIHGRIYAAIARRCEAGQLADAVTLHAEFEHAGILAEVGGSAYLAQLLSCMVGIINAGEYGRAVHDAWLRRQLIDIGETVVNNAFGAEPEMDGSGAVQVTAAVDALLRLGERAAAGASTTTSLAAAVADAVERADAAQRGDAGAARLDTGVRSFDALWQGLWPGELYFLMARSRTGKTNAMSQIARNIGARLLAEAEAQHRAPEHVHIFSLEMTAESYGLINLAATTPWTADQIRAGAIGGADAWNTLREAQAALARLPVVLDDEPGMTVSALITRARVVARTRRTRLILIDYGELIRRGKEEARMGLPEWIPLLGYRLKELAKSLGVPVVALRQINKSRDTAESGRPTLTDLPYDGGQAADAVFALHRPELTMGDQAPEQAATAFRGEDVAAKARSVWRDQREAVRGVAEFGALKRRFGPTGWAKLRFDGPRMTFVDPPKEEGPPEAAPGWWQE